jgi:hypothetical protein
MQHVIEKGLSRTALVNSYKAHLYEHQGKAERIEQFTAEHGIEYGLLFVTRFFLYSPDCPLNKEILRILTKL